MISLSPPLSPLLLCLLALCAFAPSLASAASAMASSASLPPLPKSFTLYEQSTRPWLYALSQKYKRPIARLADIPDAEFVRLKKLGFDFVWCARARAPPAPPLLTVAARCCTG